MINLKTSKAKSRFRASLYGLALLFPCIAVSQEIDLQRSIDAAFSALTELDGKAGACISATRSGNLAQEHCDDFMSAVDGELMAGYLQHCASVKSWRDTYVSQMANSNEEIENSAEILKRLIDIEFTCGQNALQARTQHVHAAFSLLQDGSRSNAQPGAKLIRELAELKFNAIESRERQLLENSQLQ
ncbi:MAG: hypothetical protein COA96_18310, partial [SAR86 cluster bacterium]